MTEAATLYNVGKKEKKEEPDMQHVMLRKLMGTNVYVHLMNGIRLTGKLTAHDRFTITLDARQLVFKHAITTIQPTEDKPSRWQEHMRKQA